MLTSAHPRRSRLCSKLLRHAVPQASLSLALLVLPLLGVGALLTAASGNLRVSNDGVDVAAVLCFALVGLIVASHEPRNPIGWLLIAVALVVLLDTDLKLYALYAYRPGHHGLPLSRLAVFGYSTSGLLPFVFGLPTILLFR